MRNILSFKIFKREYPYCYKEFLNSHYAGNPNFMDAIESLLFNFGLGVVLQSVESNYGKHIGYTSYVRIYPDNKLKKEPADIIEIEDYKKFKKHIKAQTATTIAALNMLEDSLHFMYPTRH